MKTLRPIFLILLTLAPSACAARRSPAVAAAPAPRRVVRCAVIGGLASTGLWAAVARSFEEKTGCHAQLVVAGPKETVAQAVIDGQADLATIHACDAVVNLVADGKAAGLTPWIKNDMVIVGPADDPAKIHGMTDAVAALQKIIDSKSTFLVQSSAGAFEVLHDLLAAGDLALDMDHTHVLLEDRNKRVLLLAQEQHAYTIVGRIPFYNGKLDNDGLQIMVQGDAHLRRPYLVVVAAPGTNPDANALAAFLVGPEAQKIVAGFGKGVYDDQPLFFPVVPVAR